MITDKKFTTFRLIQLKSTVLPSCHMEINSELVESSSELLVMCFEMMETVVEIS